MLQKCVLFHKSGRCSKSLWPKAPHSQLDFVTESPPGLVVMSVLGGLGLNRFDSLNQSTGLWLWLHLDFDSVSTRLARCNHLHGYAPL